MQNEEYRMTIRPDIQNFLEELEIYAKRKLNYPVEVGELLHAVLQTGLVDEFESLLFQAKFLVRSQEVMKRIGPSADGFNNLSKEFQDNLRKATDVLKILIGRTSEDIQQRFTNTFLLNETESMYRFMNIASDLSWIKNWQLDGKTLPYETKSTVHFGSQWSVQEEGQKEKISGPFARIQKSAWIGIALFLLFLFIDPPVTILGRILALGIAVFLVYIILQIRLIIRSQNHN